MITDSIVEELHKQREEYMERFQNDFEAVVRDIKSREASSPTPSLEPPATPTAPRLFTLESAPEDDEPETPEEAAAVAEAWREHSEGD